MCTICAVLWHRSVEMTQILACKKIQLTISGISFSVGNMHSSSTILLFKNAFK